MSKDPAWAFAESYTRDDHAVDVARTTAGTLGVTAIGTGTFALLRTLVTAHGASAIVEVGTGAGVSGLALLRSMPPTGVLTTIDIVAEHQQAAKRVFKQAGSHRVRTIIGRDTEVLRKLADNSYDVFFADTDAASNADYLAPALRLLRPGGMIIFNHALAHGRVVDPANRDPDIGSVRTLLRTVRENKSLSSCLLPTGDGVLVAVKQ
ncbi:O-methyltransferase [Spelaeicoccus albus]|uniref:Putative O-methyltransferase YrrM n=1 Tax=Spelaeicoccus albus TaxID=1280376 RepID=A0A7Z0D399_9MICO|nr:O-methyltransferase [Spelaeicoccus albus]NYI68083.1 putative O-methyltransferase YrrM [Spelaeicoccus albus]